MPSVRVFAIIWMLALVLTTFGLQNPKSTSEKEPAGGQIVLRSETALVTVRFHVVRKNRFADDIRPENIQVLADGKPQRIALLENGMTARRSVPVDLVLVFDNSGSVMKEGLLDPLVFKENLLDGLGYARIAVYSFSNRLRRLALPTRDMEELRRALPGVMRKNAGAKIIPYDDTKRVGSGGTLLYESVIQAIRDVSAYPGQSTRLMLIFSDAFSTSTGADHSDAIEAAQSSGIPLYPVVLGHERLQERARIAQERAMRNARNPAPQAGVRRHDYQEMQLDQFAGLGDLTGGRSFDPRSMESGALRTILQIMVHQIQSEYVTGYYIEQRDPGPKPHRVEVKLMSKDKGKITGGSRIVNY